MVLENLKFNENSKKQKIVYFKKSKKKNFSTSKKYFFFYCKNFPFLERAHKNFLPSKIENFFLKKNNLFGVSTEKFKFPKTWSIEKRYRWLFNKKKYFGWSDLEISPNKLKIKYRGLGKTDEDAAGIFTDNFIPNNLFIFYFEIKILNTGKNGFIGIGLCDKDTNLDRLPGWEKNSLGYHGDDGYFFRDSGTGTPYGPCFGKNDVIGVCLNFIEKIVFFTKNGLSLKIAFSKILNTTLKNRLPFIGLRTKGECIEANFGNKVFEFDLNSYKTHFQKFYEKKILSFHKFIFKNSSALNFSKFQNFKLEQEKTKDIETSYNSLFSKCFLLKKNNILKIYGEKHYWRTFFLFLKIFFSENLFLKKKQSKKSYCFFLLNFKNILNFFSNLKNFPFKIKEKKSKNLIFLETEDKFFKKKKRFKISILKKKILYFFEKRKFFPSTNNFCVNKGGMEKSIFVPIFDLFLKIIIKWKENSNLKKNFFIFYPFFGVQFLKKIKFFKNNNSFDLFNSIFLFLIHKRLELFDLKNWIN
ncbi:ranbpm (nucleomorph) [Hemiselmis andersenii]|uniref:Ranbpm n=2 Tax=Hemiselmis andersenii TaxID=464988 RepID=A9BKV6_HEMAN|nr:ranbpm [Hemiselmis andersenii]ABW98111.1 ranbpm [Hemiselmis andersenii]